MKKQLVSSIKTKFMLVSTLIVALSSVTWGSWFWLNERQHLLEKLEAEGRLLLTSIQPPIVDAILYEKIGVLEENAGLLDNFVEEIVGNRELPVIYAFITDDNGKVVAHSNYQEFGKRYHDPLTIAALTGDGFLGRKVADYRTGDPVFDMAMPLRIAGKSWGALRVGVSLAPLERELSTLKVQIVTFSGIFFLISNAFFYLVGLAMSRPLKRLSTAMAEVDYESLEVTVPLKRSNDEIGRLQESFGEMLSRLKQSERERRRAVARMIQNEKLATIGKIVAGVAHEVNNPLMVMSASLFHLEGKVPRELRRYLESHKEGIERIESIVRQLTDFSRVGSLDLQPVTSDLFFSEAVRFAGMAIKKHDVRFVSNDAAPRTVLSIEKGKLHQVVLNLLLNAADASPPGGVVQLLAGIDGGDYLLAVRDQGKGISPEEMERIFEIFYTTKPVGEGTGIGLAISKEIVEMHGGNISVESRPGETTFTVKVPLQKGSDRG